MKTSHKGHILSDTICRRYPEYTNPHRQRVSSFRGQTGGANEWLMCTRVAFGGSEKVQEQDGGNGCIRTLCVYPMPLNSYFRL